ncbi:hypothetical protein Taro_036271 [Colocasia esculenta]|uniref:Uncharacterized protein n=1 Tax=Colocasia esculenta TaxID=4460 RepID=A0A843VWZ1_COLES|nr:hypothetical protein [Colocasia esculenta]
MLSGSNDSLDYVNAWRGNKTESLMISPFPRFSDSNVSLDYENAWWGNNTESACHGDRKLCSTWHENYSPGETRIFARSANGTAREAPIQNWHFDPVSTRPHSTISDSAQKFLSGSVVAGRRCARIRTPLRSNRYRNHLCDYNSESTLRDVRHDDGFAEFCSRADILPWSVCTSTPIVIPLE